MQQYLDLVQQILDDGDDKDDRTGVGTRAIHGAMMKFDLRKGFPLVTTKKVNFKAIVAELLWFLRGSTNIRDLDSKIWDEWVQNRPIHGEGDVGPIYGFQWRHWGAPWMPTVKLPSTGIVRSIQQEEMTERLTLQAKRVGGVAKAMVQNGYDYGEPQYLLPASLDPIAKASLARSIREGNPDPNLMQNVQIEHGGDRLIRKLLTGEVEPDVINSYLGGIDQLGDAIEMIKVNPKSRRILVSAWNPSDVPDMGLPPCHMFFQLHPSLNGFLDLTMYQRSCDMALGVPFNIASYALLLSLIANECELKPRWLTHMLGDTHIYTNHVEGLTTQLSRTPRDLPELWLQKGKSVFEITPDDIKLAGYHPDKKITFKVAV